MNTTFLSVLLMLLTNLALGQADSKMALSIGDHYGGGIVFSVEASGKHGLIAAPFDQAYNAIWGYSGNADAVYMNDGAKNSEKIIEFGKRNSHFPQKVAACICDTLTLGGFKDWYLPSINELKSMYDNQQVIGNFIAWDYCSSTERSNGRCYNIHFRPHKKIIYHDRKYRQTYVVRCIRKF